MSECVTATCPHGRGAFIWHGDGPEPDGRWPWVHDTMEPGTRGLRVCELMEFATAARAGEVCACGDGSWRHRPARRRQPPHHATPWHPCADCACPDLVYPRAAAAWARDVARDRESGPRVPNPGRPHCDCAWECTVAGCSKCGAVIPEADKRRLLHVLCLSCKAEAVPGRLRFRPGDRVRARASHGGYPSGAFSGVAEGWLGHKLLGLRDDGGEWIRPPHDLDPALPVAPEQGTLFDLAAVPRRPATRGRAVDPALAGGALARWDAAASALGNGPMPGWMRELPAGWLAGLAGNPTAAAVARAEEGLRMIVARREDAA